MSHPVKLKSVKNGKIFPWLPVFIQEHDKKGVRAVYTAWPIVILIPCPVPVYYEYYQGLNKIHRMFFP